MDWAKRQQITLMYIQPGKPTHLGTPFERWNACIEWINRTVRHEWLEMLDFNSIEHTQEEATKWS